MSKKRKYEKKSPYWDVRKAVASGAPVIISDSKQKNVLVEPKFDESPHFTATASCGSGGGNSYINTFSPTISLNTSFPNLSGMGLPFALNGNGYFSVGAAINLAYTAYFSSSIVRNTINLLQDFSVTNLHVKSENETVKRFFENWLKSININDFMYQYFLEYYRSGNVFIYKFDGKISDDKFRKMKSAFGSKNPILPIRYIILNPMQIYLQLGPTSNYNYSKMLSTYEIQRLRNPQTEEDRQVLKSFPKDIQEQIKRYAAYPYIYAPLDTKRLYYVFYRKMDYEPLAVPMIFPVLPDIEWKMELKKIDASLTRTFEQVLLLVTCGDKADEYNAGLNPQNLQALQKIFQNQTIGRVLVADYTTKAEWKIPDLKDLLGPAKYERVNQDIQEGLQYMFFGNEKFANANVKAKMFAETLKEGRRVFIDNFLNNEIQKICQSMNFKNIPTVEFEPIDIQDKAVLQRIFFQMAQLGLLTPEQLNEALESGVLPSESEMEAAQEKYSKLRQRGLFMPLTGGSSTSEGGRPNGAKGPKTTNTVSPIGTSKASHFSMKNIIDHIPSANKVKESVATALKKKYKIKKLSETQETVATAIAKSIIVNEPEAAWQDAVASYIESPKEIPKEIGNQIDSICAEYDVDAWTAVILHKSQNS